MYQCEISWAQYPFCQFFNSQIKKMEIQHFISGKYGNNLCYEKKIQNSFDGLDQTNQGC